MKFERRHIIEVHPLRFLASVLCGRDSLTCVVIRNYLNSREKKREQHKQFQHSCHTIFFPQQWSHAKWCLVLFHHSSNRSMCVCVNMLCSIYCGCCCRLSFWRCVLHHGICVLSGSHHALLYPLKTRPVHASPIHSDLYLSLSVFLSIHLSLSPSLSFHRQVLPQLLSTRTLWNLYHTWVLIFHLFIACSWHYAQPWHRQSPTWLPTQSEWQINLTSFLFFCFSWI